MKIISFGKNIGSVNIKFEDGYITYNRTYHDFKKGNIKDLLYPEVCGMGYIGIGNYSNKNARNQYVKWCQMLHRCYGMNNHNISYKNCSVCNEWLNFQNFAKWYDENYYQVLNENMEIDKDILCKGNKVYSSKNCIFVPHTINSLFVKCNRVRGKYPIGVYFNKKIGKFIAQVNCYDKNQTTIGRYNNYQDAFLAYKKVKEKYIKYIADQYKEVIPKVLYDAMYKYQVEITD